MLPSLARTRVLNTRSLTRQLRPAVTAFNSSSSSSSIILRQLSTRASPVGTPASLSKLSSSLLDSSFLPLPKPFRTSASARLNSTTASSSSSSSSAPPPPPPPPQAPANLSLTARLKLLFKTHGWTALTLYLILSFIDFSLTFVLVWSIGADRVREFEDWVLMHLGWRRRGEKKNKGDNLPITEEERDQGGVLREKFETWKSKHQDPEKNLHPVREVSEDRDGAPSELGTVALLEGAGASGDAKRSGYSAYATTAVLAYAIHKTALLPVRVGLTVWATPKVVRVLRSWGWNVGQMPATAAVAAQAAARKVKTPK